MNGSSRHLEQAVGKSRAGNSGNRFTNLTELRRGTFGPIHRPCRTMYPARCTPRGAPGGALGGAVRGARGGVIGAEKETRADLNAPFRAIVGLRSMGSSLARTAAEPPLSLHPTEPEAD